MKAIIFCVFVSINFALGRECPQVTCPVCRCQNSELGDRTHITFANQNREFEERKNVFTNQNSEVGERSHITFVNHDTELGDRKNTYASQNSGLGERKNVFSNQNSGLGEQTLVVPNPSNKDAPSAAVNQKSNDNSLMRSSELFSLELLEKIATAPRDPDANFVVSPYSVWALMTLVAEGSSDHSLQQLKEILHLPNELNRFGASYKNLEQSLLSNSSTAGLSMNQAVFIDQTRPVLQNYAHALSNDYKAFLQSLDFSSPTEAASTINDYVRKQTHGKISSIVNPPDIVDSHVLLTSSIFFNGQWKFPFNASNTKQEHFYRENGELLGYVPMMTQQSPFKYAIMESLSASFVELPYGDGERLAMLLIYPLHNVSLASVFKGLRSSNITKIHQEVYRYEDVGDIILSVPKFKLDGDVELRPILRQMGIYDIFEPRRAQLSRMSQRPTYISQVFQRVIIEVDEVGTVAAASSYANAVDFSYPMEFIFNRPFGFMITDRLTHTLLFAGQIRDPLSVSTNEEQ